MAGDCVSSTNIFINLPQCGNENEKEKRNSATEQPTLRKTKRNFWRNLEK